MQGTPMKEVADSSAPSRISLSVVIMAFNEEENLPHLLSRLVPYLDGREELREWEIIVVDDGSTDGTAEVARCAGDGEARIRVVRHPRNLGMGAAIRTGYQACGCDYVTQMPADLQVPPETFDLFLPHARHYDLVLSVYEDRSAGWLRRLLAGGYRLTARAILGRRADYTGTMVFRRSLVDRIAIHSNSFVANLEFPLKALALGATHHLVAFRPSPRLSGTSKVANSRRIAFVVTELVRLRLRGL